MQHKEEDDTIKRELVGYLPYKNEEHGFKLLYPKDWKKNEGSAGTVVAFASPKDPSGLTSVNLLVQELPPQITLEEFSRQSLEQMQPMLMNAQHQVWSEDLLKRDGKRLKFEAPMGPMLMTVYQAWTVTDSRAFIFTFSSPSEHHNNYRKDIEVLLESFELIGSQDPTKKPIDLCCFKFIENEEHRFRIKCPLSWQAINTSGSPVFQAEFNAVLGPKDAVPAYLRLDVVVTNLPDPSWDLDKYSQISSMRLADITVDGEVPPKTKTMMGGIEGYEVTYTSDIVKKGMLSKQIYTIKDGKVYIVTTSAASLKEGDTRPFPLFERLYSSFEFLEKDYTSKSSCVVFEHLIHRVGIEFSEEWRPSSGLGTVVNFEHGGNGSNIPFYSSLSLVVADPPGAIDSLDAFEEMMKKQLDMAVDNAVILRQTDTELAGIKGRKLQYKGEIANTPFKFDQYFILEGGKAYIISFNALHDRYDAEAVFARQLISSFALF